MTKATWYFDFISPFAYLQLARFTELPKNLDINLRPVLFGSLLKHWGQLGPAEIPPKRRFVYRFFKWNADRLGLPFIMPPSHPYNPLPALRLCVAAGSQIHQVKEIFTIEQMLPAIGQGTIALQCKKGDQKTLNILKAINDKETYYCIKAERALLETIGGDCDTAIGGLAKLSNDKISLKSELFSNNGKKKFEFQSSGHFREAKEIGYKVGKELLKKAGSDFTTQGN